MNLQEKRDRDRDDWGRGRSKDRETEREREGEGLSVWGLERKSWNAEAKGAEKTGWLQKCSEHNFLQNEIWTLCIKFSEDKRE